MDGELGVDSATAVISTQPRPNSSLHPRARSFDHQLLFDIIRDDSLERFAVIRVRQGDISDVVKAPY